MIRAARYWHTLRHLRPIQFYARVRFRLARPTPDLRPEPPRRGSLQGRWVASAPHRASLVGRNRFRLLNQTHSIDEHGWDSAALDRLWRYNLHYFDDLTAADAGERVEDHRALLERWVRENPPGRGTGWEPYPTSLRIVNWVKWSLAGNELPAACVQSLAVQARWLGRRLEWHLLGNHLFSNGKALVFAAAMFEGPEADSWAARGLAILGRELPEQILRDGAQFERSPMYHALALEDMLDLCNIAAACPDVVNVSGSPPVAGWRARVPDMWRWLSAMTHPDGEISFFNDAAIGIAPTASALGAYATRLGLSAPDFAGPGATVLEPSGYVRVERGAAVALLDVAPVGPDYLPGHAHADTLSFELSLFGARLFVNSGTSCYGSGDERQRQRGTAAHSTVVVNGEDSSEVWGGFRVARRARPMELDVREGATVAVRCAHDGYRRLRGSPTHTREWTFVPGAMTVEDRIAGTFGRAEARYHLHPAVTVSELHRSPGETVSTVRLQLAGLRAAQFTAEQGDLAIEPTTWHPEFGSAVASRCLVVRFAGPAVRARLTWEEGS